MPNEKKQYPEDHFLGVGMAIGIAIFSGVGVAISTSTGNPGLIGIGPAIGIPLGLAIGKSMEEKHRKKGMIRPLTEAEKKNREKGKIIGIITIVIGLLAFISLIGFRILN